MKAETLFLQAAELKNDEERQAFIDASDASEDIKSETRQLLADHDEPDEFFDEPVGGAPDDQPSSDSRGFWNTHRAAAIDLAF